MATPPDTDPAHVWRFIELSAPIGCINRTFQVCARCEIVSGHAEVQLTGCTFRPPGALPHAYQPIYLRTLMEEGWYPAHSPHQEKLDLTGDSR